MTGLKRNAMLVLNSLFCISVLGIIQSKSDLVSLLWNLTNFAIQSRQGYSQIYENPYKPYQSSDSPLLNTQLILEALYSITKNDDHNCVPKLLCEMTAGRNTLTSIGRQSSFLPAFQVDMDSLIGLLSSFEAPTTSPMLSLGKAILLGYNSKHSDTCTYAYPRCPNNPDVLLNYLNNYNGGFFRYFNGLEPSYVNQNNIQSSSSSPNQIFQDYPTYQQSYGYRYSKERYEGNSLNNNKYIDNLKFPYNDNGNAIQEHHDKISFPAGNFQNGYNENMYLKFNGIPTTENYRDGRKLTFPKDYEENYQESKPIAFIYSDRTGTGELLVDTPNF